MKASLTIEASLIYPITFFLSVLLVFYTFYMHDRLVITADMYRIVMEAYTTGDDTDTSDINERLDEKCLLSHSFDITYDNADNTLNVTADTDHTYISAFKNYERCDFIRQYSALLNLIRKDD